MKTVIVHGPRQCGKSKNRGALRRYFGCKGVWDDFVIFAGCGLPSVDMLHITHHDAKEISAFLKKRQADLPFEILVVDYFEAMRDIFALEPAERQKVWSPRVRAYVTPE